VKSPQILTLFALLILIGGPDSRAASKTLDIYFIDTEGGAATLIVTPSGESLLIDSGFPGARDAGRIAHVAIDVAGLKQIDHYLTTHWHQDHVGGIATLVEQIPVKHYYDHGLPTTTAPDIFPELIEAYRRTSQGKSVALKSGDEIKLTSIEGMPPLRVQVFSANGSVLGETVDPPEIQPCGANFQAKPEDKTDNKNSVSILLSFGRFEFFDGGDLSWNIENRLACPRNLVGAVDVFQVDHHGSDGSNNPLLVRALSPRVAIIDNGPRKGGEAGTFRILQSVTAIQAIYQLHRNLRTSVKANASPDFVANDEEACSGEYIKLSVNGDGRSYIVNIPSKQIIRSYKTR
jgi:beta-lactamase superfamily II metal-dependent hydrolase